MSKYEEYKGYQIKFEQETRAESPREMMDELARMICFHKRYFLGDKHDMSIEELLEVVARDDVVAMPLYLYDHSGLAMSTSRTWPFDCPWDSGQVGYIYATYEEVLNWFGGTEMTEELKARALDSMESEVRTYNSYLAGDVWMWQVEKDDVFIEGVGGYYGWDDNYEYMLSEAKATIDHEVAKQEEHEAKLRQALKDRERSLVVLEVRKEYPIIVFGKLFIYPNGDYAVGVGNTVANFPLSEVESVEDQLITLKGAEK
jgi:hypothetical protein